MNKSSLGEAVLPAAVVAVVGMMIFPMPVVLLDVLLVCNISFSLVLLLSSISLARPERFTSLPAILLLTTLFRLGLNIATTRQLLSGSTVPGLIITFGNFVVNGNYAVGIVIFLIITLVQFVVISKGAERVAEVAARFTLDAMPGKQMSIDADLRAGILSFAEAKERRYDLQREAKLYGALDGAMKFIKGDAIAGLCIAAVNIAGGLTVGVIQQHLSLSEAAGRFTIYTIGDSLASQIPALLVAVAAGICVTRVADRDGEILGRDMFAQLTSQPQALRTSSVVLGLLGCIPGLPFFPLIAVAALLALCAHRSTRQRRETEKTAAAGAFHAQMFSGVALRMSLSAAHLLQREEILPQSVQKLRRELFERWGILVPDLQFDIDRAPRSVCTKVLLNGVEMLEVGREGAESRTGGTYSSTVVAALCGFFEEHMAELINDTQTRMLLDLHHAAAEDLINSVVPEMITVTGLTGLLRSLVTEQVSVRSLGAILQAIAEYKLLPKENRSNVVPFARAAAGEAEAGFAQHLDLLAEVRIALCRLISREAADSQGRVRAWVLDAETDALLEQSAFAQVPLALEISQHLAAACAAAREDCGMDAPLVILTTKTARWFCRRLLTEHRVGARVLAVEEISPDVRLEVLGEVGINGARQNAAAADAGDPAREAIVAEKIAA